MIWKTEEFWKWFIWKVYVFQEWFIMVKAWFDKVWFDANFYVHIKSQGHHGVYEPHDEKWAYTLKGAYKA